MHQHIKVINTITNVLLSGTILSFGFVSASVIKQNFMTSSEPNVVIERIDENPTIAQNDTIETPIVDETATQEVAPLEDSTENTDISSELDTSELDTDEVTDAFPLTAERIEDPSNVDENLLPLSDTQEENFSEAQQELDNMMNNEQIDEVITETISEDESTEDIEQTLASILEQQVLAEAETSSSTLIEETPTEEENVDSNLVADAGNKQVDDVLDINPENLTTAYTLNSDYIALPTDFEKVLPVPVQENESAMSNSGYIVLSELTRASILAGYCVTSNGHEGFALNLQKLVGRESFTKHENELMQYEDVGEPILEKYDQLIAKNYPTIQSQKELCQAALDSEIVVRSFIPGV